MYIHHFFLVPHRYVELQLCGKILSNEIYRLKQHISRIKGNVTSCKKSSDEDRAKCKNVIEEANSNKRQKSRHEDEVRQEIILEEDEDIGSSQGIRESRILLDLWTVLHPPSISILQWMEVRRWDNKISMIHYSNKEHNKAIWNKLVFDALKTQTRGHNGIKDALFKQKTQ